MKLICALLSWVLSEAVVVVGPAYPPNAFAGGNVVAVLHVSSGAVAGVDVLSGDAPFAEPAQAALGAWRFDAAQSGDVLVVVNFRTPTLYAIGSAAQKVPKAAALPGLAYP